MMDQKFSKKVINFVSPIQTLIFADQRVEEALTSIRQQKVENKIFYFYVVDRENRLKGVVSTRHLLLSPPEGKIQDIMEKTLISVSSGHYLHEAMEKLTQHRLLALPVIDQEQRLLGIVDIQHCLDEAIDLAKGQRNQLDFFQLLGITIEEGKQTSVWKIYKNRMPWIFCNMLGGISCAIISRVFELVLTKVLLLAFFIPLVLTLSESIAMQSMTHSLQLLHKPQLSWRRLFSRAISEWRLLTLLALSCGILVGAVSLLWGGGISPAIVIAFGLMISIAVSGSVGAIIPLILHAKRLDPKVAAGPVVLMFVDVVTTSAYLGLATWWLL